MATKKDKSDNGQSTALTVLDQGNYALAKFTSEQLVETVVANFGEDSLTPNDLDRVRIPSGNVRQWALPSLEGEDVMSKAIRGVIVMYRPGRAYWERGLDESGGGSPPDCSSSDGKMGVGQPGGVCANCPLNQFGSATKGKGKACKEMRLLFLLRPESLLPLVMVLPPTSIKPMKKYLQRLTSAAIPYPKVETEIGLVEASNADGIKYSQATFKMLGKLDDASAKHVAAYAESMKGAFEAVELTADDAQGAADA